ncbi:MAG: LuxR C-terminal-related transcriptional regulator [Mycobacterium sp.]
MTESDDAAVIDAVYSAAVEPALWPVAITALADHLGAHGGMLVRNADDPELSSCIVGRISPDIADRYIREYSNNPWTRAAEAVPIGDVAVLSRLYDLREGRHLAWYADVLLPTNTQDMAYLSLPGFTSASSVGGLAFCFSETGARNVDDAAHRLRDLRPHLTRAVYLSQQVDAARIHGQRLDYILNTSPRPILMLSAAHRVVGLNPAAETLLRQEEGLTINSAGRLTATSAVADDALQAAIIRAAAPTHTETDGPAVVHINRSLKSPLRLLTSPLPRSHALPALDPESQAVVLVTVIDPQSTRDHTIGSLSAIYGLTPGEARVAALLASGIGREKAAQDLQLSVETIKKHTASCFRKIGVGSQAGLARAVSILPIQ